MEKRASPRYAKQQGCILGVKTQSRRVYVQVYILAMKRKGSRVVLANSFLFVCFFMFQTHLKQAERKRERRQEIVSEC